MATTVTVNSVTTGDAAPTTAPHRISDKPTKDEASVVFTPATDSEPLIRAIKIRLGGTHRNNGTKLLQMGMACGDGTRCGQPDAQSLALPENQPQSHTVAYDDTGPAAEGTHEINVHAGSSEGWA